MIDAELKKFSNDFFTENNVSVFDFALILGSGFAKTIHNFQIIKSIPYADIPGFTSTSVPGHKGRLSLVKASGRTGLIFEGRFHYYEGLSMRDVTKTVQLAWLSGARRLFISNASGGVNPEMEIGDIMMVTDQINMMGDNPLRGSFDPNIGGRFLDMSECFSKGLNHLILQAASKLNISLKKGTYVGVSGPIFETPAEYKFFRIIGADAVGMSTVPEVIMGHYLGMEVCCLSVITDLGVEGKIEKINHEQVIKNAELSADKVVRIYLEVLQLLPEVG